MSSFKALILTGLLILHWTFATEYNIALNKAVTTSTNVTDHLATMATDQDLNTYVQVNPGNNLGTWIQFDLKAVYNITKIIIWPTTDEDYSLARVSSYVRLTKNTAHDTDDFCTYTNPMKGNSYNCSKNNNAVKGRYVLLKKEASATTENIKIAEIAILTEDKDFVLPITGQVEQIHVFDNSQNYIALKAIDGDLYTCIFTAQEIVANRNMPGWWRTDLGDTYKVSAVNINDYNAEYTYRGNYSVYVDSGDYTKQQLCSFFSQSSPQSSSYLQLKCVAVLTGRYLTVERIKNNDRPDALNFCEIQVVALVKDLSYTPPKGYNPTSTPVTTATTVTRVTTANLVTTATTVTRVITASLVTKTMASLFASSRVEISSISPSDLSNCSECSRLKAQLLEMEKNINLLEKEKAIIGSVVGFLAAVIFSIGGYVIGYVCLKKNVEASEYEKATERAMEPIHEYESTTLNDNDGDYPDVNEVVIYEVA